MLFFFFRNLHIKIGLLSRLEVFLASSYTVEVHVPFKEYLKWPDIA